jgi:hypothetical protein
MSHPTRKEVANKLRELLLGVITRKNASEWSCTWLLGTESVEDRTVWSALELIGAADLCSTDREFLYEKEDYLECLNTLGESDLLDFEVGQIVL